MAANWFQWSRTPLCSQQWKRKVITALWARATPEKKNNGITGRISCSGSWQVFPSFFNRQCVNQRDSLWGLGHCTVELFSSLKATDVTSFCITFNVAFDIWWNVALGKYVCRTLQLRDNLKYFCMMTSASAVQSWRHNHCRYIIHVLHVTSPAWNLAVIFHWPLHGMWNTWVLTSVVLYGDLHQEIHPSSSNQSRTHTSLF